jgi:phosphohistidine phosphatase
MTSGHTESMTSHRLIIIRHAKTAPGHPDISRELTTRGQRDAGATGEFLARIGVTPALAVISPAARARATWAIACTKLPVPVDEIIDDRVYDNDVETLFEMIQALQDRFETVALVGHNPSLSELAQRLDDGTGDAVLRQQLQGGLVTSAVAVFDVPGDWYDAHEHSASLIHSAVPRGGE